MGESNLVRNLVFDINKVSTELGVPPSELTPAQFLKETDYSAYQLKKVGGFRKLVNTYFRHNEKDLKIIQQMKSQSAYINKLETVVGNMESFKEKLIETVSQRVSEMRIDTKLLDKRHCLRRNNGKRCQNIISI